MTKEQMEQLEAIEDPLKRIEAKLDVLLQEQYRLTWFRDATTYFPIKMPCRYCEGCKKWVHDDHACVKHKAGEIELRAGVP